MVGGWGLVVGSWWFTGKPFYFVRNFLADCLLFSRTFIDCASRWSFLSILFKLTNARRRTTAEKKFTRKQKKETCDQCWEFLLFFKGHHTTRIKNNNFPMKHTNNKWFRYLKKNYLKDGNFQIVLKSFQQWNMCNRQEGRSLMHNSAVGVKKFINR